jgi:hypothetical protein
VRRVLYGILLATAVFLLITPLSVPVFTSNTPLSVLNTGWDGCSSFGKLLYRSSSGRVVPLLSTFDSYGIGGKTGTLIIIGPDLGYSSAEVEEIRSFLENGGTVILMDDFGTGNGILAGLNVSARFSGKPYRDIFYMKNENFPLIVRILDPALAENVTSVVLDVPTVLTGASGEAYTSKVAIVGSNFRQYPVMTELPYGKGKLILFSDPSAFINDLYPLNEPFIKNFVNAYVTGTVYIDEAHHANFNVYQRGYVSIRRAVSGEAIFKAFLAVALLALFIESGLAMGLLEASLSLLLRFLPSEGETSVEDIVRKLSSEGYPEDRLLKMIREIETGKKLGGES